LKRHNCASALVGIPVDIWDNDDIWINDDHDTYLRMLWSKFCTEGGNDDYSKKRCKDPLDFEMSTW
jgi:hypothetical protein